jgi:CheY-like chemotaxis protein
LEATETVLGFPPDALLMTSAYHTMHDLDLPGFLFVKTHFWDKGEPNVEVYIRRRNIQGQLVWLASKALDYVTVPIPGIIIVESLVITEAEEQLASSLNRITRITAILVQAVEAAKLAKAKPPPAPQSGGGGAGDENANNNSNNNAAAHGGTAASTAGAAGEESVLQSLIRIQQETGSRNPDDGKALQELLQIVTTAKMNNGQLEPSEEEILKNLGAQKEKGFDPFWMMEKVRKGVRLDLGMMRLFPEEVKMIALVLSGKVSVDIVAPRVLMALRSGQGLGAAFREFKLDNERDKSPRRLHHGSGSTINSGGGGSGSSNLGGSSNSLGSAGGGGVAGYNSDGLRSTNLSNSFALVPQPAKTARISKTSMNAPPPPISVINVSYTFIGNVGMDMLSEVIYMDGSALRTIDVSFCGLDEKGMLSFARALARRKKKEIPPIKGLILSGNVLTARAALELGMALVGSLRNGRSNKRSRPTNTGGGYDTDNTDSGGEEDEDDDDDDFSSNINNNRRGKTGVPRRRDAKESGLQLLHLASTSLTPEAVRRLLDGLGPHCTLRELSLASNALGAAGTNVLVRFLETGKDRSVVDVPMPFLDRLDMSNNNLGDDGTTQLTRAILKRSKVHLVDLQLSSNAITSVGVETMMNKLLNHNLVSLSLYKNLIGDQGCQLVAASLQSMKALSRLNLSFNQIGSRGIISLMRRLIGCESITFLGLSGNILKISGAIALAYTLSQHPRLEELHLDNCCLSQAAQCHIVAGIISNRWVPMKRLMGYAVGPPMVAIGALKQYSPNMNNEECFRIRKDEQMKTMLRWMETNRVAKQTGITPDPNLAAAAFNDATEQRFLSPDFIANLNDVHGTPSQNSYLRLLGWLSLIPFDDDELTALQKYFFDGDGGEGDRGSDGYINLKLRGDLLAALDSDMADEIREELPSLGPAFKGSVGLHLTSLDLHKLEDISNWNAWKAFKGEVFDRASQAFTVDESCEASADMDIINDDSMKASEHSGTSQESEEQDSSAEVAKLPRTDSVTSSTTKEKIKNKVKPRISMFPMFEQQLEDLKATAADMIEQEDDPMHHEVILTQYAEASLTILRQLRYHCMNRGLDGWVHGGLKRKILIVDDSRVTRKLVSQAFEKANFIVDTASNGAEGVEKLKASIYDIAFMDIDMPVMNGFEATKTLRKWEDTMRPGARQPICALTATYVDDFERSELMKFKEAGLDVMESKPCNIPRLFKVVDDVAPMMSDLRISISQREKSDPSLNKAAATDLSNY